MSERKCYSALIPWCHGEAILARHQPVSTQLTALAHLAQNKQSGPSSQPQAKCWDQAHTRPRSAHVLERAVLRAPRGLVPGEVSAGEAQ